MQNMNNIEDLAALSQTISLRSICPLLQNNVHNFFYSIVKPQIIYSDCNFLGDKILSIHTYSDSLQHNVFCRNDLWRTPCLDTHIISLSPVVPSLLSPLLFAWCPRSHPFAASHPSSPFLPCRIASQGQNGQEWHWPWQREKEG